MSIDMKCILSFLSALEKNNSLDWMRENKKLYSAAKLEFENMVGELIERISLFDDSVVGLRAGDLVFRLNRDTRFSKDKAPYNPSFRAHISSGGKVPIPAGYYISIRPGGSFLGGGLFAVQFPDATEMIRQRIADDGGELQSILDSEEFRSSFTISGEKLKNVPRGYDRAHPAAELLKHKAWDVEYSLKDEELIESEQFLALAAVLFQRMKPLNDYLNRAASGFVMPKR